ncbi:hypothetical protein [Enterovirga sp. CN4-39]|uniref:hypothetical protein n=1 Tax=Enterovirga sp. CN4-39 TaxID=3400910 RepID=UPI003C0294F9
MSIRRKLSWSTSMRDYRTESRPAASPFVVAGRFDRAAIMRRAVQVARTLRAGGASWQRRMKVALRTVWGWAKREQDAAPALPIVRAPAPVAKPARPWKTETDLMARLTRAQNHPANISQDIMTWAGFCDSRAELEAHVTRYEARA